MFSCPWGEGHVHGVKVPWGRTVLGERSMGANCPWRTVLGGERSVGRTVHGGELSLANGPWVRTVLGERFSGGEQSVGRTVHGGELSLANSPRGRTVLGRTVRGANGPWPGANGPRGGGERSFGTRRTVRIPVHAPTLCTDTPSRSACRRVRSRARTFAG